MVVCGGGFAIGGGIFETEAYFSSDSVGERSISGIFQGVWRGRYSANWYRRFGDAG